MGGGVGVSFCRVNPTKSPFSVRLQHLQASTKTGTPYPSTNTAQGQTNLKESSCWQACSVPARKSCLDLCCHAYLRPALYEDSKDMYPPFLRLKPSLAPPPLPAAWRSPVRFCILPVVFPLDWMQFGAKYIFQSMPRLLTLWFQVRIGIAGLKGCSLFGYVSISMSATVGFVNHFSRFLFACLDCAGVSSLDATPLETSLLKCIGPSPRRYLQSVGSTKRRRSCGHGDDDNSSPRRTTPALSGYSFIR